MPGYDQSFAAGAPVRESRRLPILVERAVRLLEERGGAVDADELAGWVFGSGQRGPWGSLLESILNADSRLERTPDGWRLVGRGDVAERGEDDAVVAVAIATTGSEPHRHRIVRLSAVRVGERGPGDRFDAVVQPVRRPPKYLAEAAHLHADELDEAPAFAAVAEPFRAFVGDARIAAYGVRWVLDFLAAELARAELPGLPNHGLELDDLARRVLPRRRKPGLRQIAEELGLNHPCPKYPPADADVAARVVAILLDVTPEADARTVGDGRPASIARRPHRQPLTDRSWLGEVPSTPGVYAIEDGEGRLLYVGKAVDLRRRLTSYLGRAFGLNRQLEGLAVRAARVDWQTTPSDLEARLLEARLIREHAPPFNVQRGTRPRPLLIRVAAADPAPRIHCVSAMAADGALYLGPFHTAQAARGSVALVRSVYPLACLRRTVDPPAQREAVHAAVRLLTGHKRDALAILRAEMVASTARADHAGIDRLRGLIRSVLDHQIRSSALLGAGEGRLLVVEPYRGNGARRAHLIWRGRLLASTSLADADLADAGQIPVIADQLESLARPEVSEQGDQDVPIVLQWLAERGDDLEIVPLSRLRWNAQPALELRSVT